MNSLRPWNLFGKTMYAAHAQGAIVVEKHVCRCFRWVFNNCKVCVDVCVVLDTRLCSTPTKFLFLLMSDKLLNSTTTAHDARCWQQLGATTQQSASKATGGWADGQCLWAWNTVLHKAPILFSQIDKSEKNNMWCRRSAFGDGHPNEQLFGHFSVWRDA